MDFAGSDKSFAFAHAPVAKGGAAIVVGLFGGSFSMPVPMLPLRALTIMGSYVGSPAEAREMLELVKAGKVAPIPVELRPLDRAGTSLYDLRAGKLLAASWSRRDAPMRIRCHIVPTTVAVPLLPRILLRNAMGDNVGCRFGARGRSWVSR